MIKRACVTAICTAILSAIAGPVGVAAQPTPQVGAELDKIGKQVRSRNTGGALVAGISVQLVAVAPELGGPPTGSAGQHALADAAGTVLISGLGPHIWL